MTLSKQERTSDNNERKMGQGKYCAGEFGKTRISSAAAYASFKMDDLIEALQAEGIVGHDVDYVQAVVNQGAEISKFLEAYKGKQSGAEKKGSIGWGRFPVVGEVSLTGKITKYSD